MTATELSTKDRVLVQAAARLRAMADALSESDGELLRWLEAELRKISVELWEAAD